MTASAPGANPRIPFWKSRVSKAVFFGSSFICHPFSSLMISKITAMPSSNFRRSRGEEISYRLHNITSCAGIAGEAGYL